MTPIPLQLSARDLDLIATVARYKFLTSEQLQRLFFPTGNPRTASNRLAALAKAGLLSRVFSFPKARGEAVGRPMAVYCWPSDDQRRLKVYLEARGQASRWPDFDLIAQTYNEREEFSQLYLKHETGISEFFLYLEAATAPTAAGAIAGAQLVFWERTSPMAKDLGRTENGKLLKLAASVPLHTRDGDIEEREEEVPFNPDAFFCLRTQGGHSFFFLELDNNTYSVDRFRKKLAGYKAYYDSKIFVDKLLPFYIRKYQLPIPTHRNAFRVLTLTPDEQRRNSLFLDHLTLQSYQRFLFASMADVSPQTILTPVWLRGKEYEAIAQTEKTLAPETTNALKSRWLTEQLEKMPKVSLKD